MRWINRLSSPTFGFSARLCRPDVRKGCAFPAAEHSSGLRPIMAAIATIAGSKACTTKLTNGRSPVPFDLPERHSLSAHQAAEPQICNY